MAETKTEPLELTYPLRTVARLTGLSPHVLRAWERRYEVVVPLRTEGGTRRYRSADLERLRLVKSAVDAGHRVGQIAQLGDAELKQKAMVNEARLDGPLEEILGALDRLDDATSQRLLSFQLSTLGAPRFAKEIAAPLVHLIGERWANGEMGIASEHLATAMLRSLLGSCLQQTAHSITGPRIIFATPTGECHEFGALIAALTALGAGANSLYLGTEVPVEDLLRAAENTAAVAIGLSLITIPADQASRTVESLRHGLPSDTQLWLGGSGAPAVDPITYVDRIQSLEDLERRVALLQT